MFDVTPVRSEVYKEKHIVPIKFTLQITCLLGLQSAVTGTHTVGLESSALRVLLALFHLTWLACFLNTSLLLRIKTPSQFSHTILLSFFLFFLYFFPKSFNLQNTLISIVFFMSLFSMPPFLFLFFLYSFHISLFSWCSSLNIFFACYSFFRLINYSLNYFIPQSSRIRKQLHHGSHVKSKAHTFFIP